jgi:tRNA A-37 threonylcarbamoyl transferase component Bud32
VDTPPKGSLVPATPVRAAPVRRPAWPDRAGRRRPSGQEYVDPRHPVPAIVWMWGIAFVASVTGLIVLRLVTEETAVVQAVDRALRDLLGGSPARRRLAEGLGDVAAALGYRVLWVPVAVVLAWFAQWRQLMVYLGTVSVIAALGQAAGGDAAFARAVRRGVTGSAADVMVPTWPVIVLAAVITATLFALAPAGPARRRGWVLVGAALATTGAARVALGTDSACAVLASATLGCSAAALAFHLLAPESRFPVVHRRAVKAHLRLDGPRKARVVEAVHDQLGLRVIDLLPYRLDGSAGSTPCRLVIDGGGAEGGGPESLFGKLYATTHLRSDRWYKLARVLRYGRLEDEAPFSSVRRLVEHEDYMLRLLRDSGVQVPDPLGVVEVLPGREYLLVTELVDGAVEILESGVPEEVVDNALVQVRMLWRAGAAHRDIKPSNVLVQGTRVVLIDVSFGELRPSRWRQAVDLANMMLTLSLVAGPESVLARAERLFEREEIAEAFAATSSLTVPRQLRSRMEADGCDLPGLFRRLLPGRPRISIQRWSLRRVLLALATLGGAVATVALVGLNLRAGGLL